MSEYQDYEFVAVDQGLHYQQLTYPAPARCDVPALRCREFTAKSAIFRQKLTAFRQRYSARPALLRRVEKL